MFEIKDFYASIKEGLLRNHGLKNKAMISTLQWLHMTELRYVNLSVFLSLIGNKYNPNNIGLYKDDGLAVFKNTSGPQSEKIKKTFQKMFKNKCLDVIINCNMKIVNYLGVTLNLNERSYRPYKKPNEETNYIHVNSDHPHPF